MAEEGARFTAFGKILSLALIVALVGGGGYMVYSKLGKGDPKPDVNATHKPPLHEAEATDPGNVTTVKKYEYIAADRLPPVKGVGNYKWDNNNKVVRFSYNVWSGWLPVFAANGGAKPNPNSVFAKKYGFQVELVKMDDPIMAREAFAMGEIHTLWGTADMFVLFAPALQKDSRSRPRIVQQIDWSNGGDGIVVRSSIKSVSDLKGKTIAYAPNSPSEYYLTSLLLSAGMRPSDIKAKHTATAFEAAAAFVADKSVDACVSWAPDIYTIPEKVPNTKILSSTADANKLIADVYAVRADFAKEHPEIVEGLVAGIFEGMDMLKQDPKPAYAAMAAEFNMKPEEIAAMRNDAHPTNFAENVQFFLNASNPTNFERTWKNATNVYAQLGRLEPGTIPTPFDAVMDFTYIQALDKKGTFKHQQDESIAKFTPGSYKAIKGGAEAPILTQTIRVNFFPNSANPYEPARDEHNNPIKGKLYDPSVAATIEEVGRLSGQFDRAIILIEGHTDSSRRGQVPEQAVKDLSLDRAESIKKALIEKFKFDPNKFVIKGSGWDKPADPKDSENHALNRRVEISVYPPESQ